MNYAHPEYLVSTEWLADNLNRENVNVFDTTVFLRPDPESTYRVESGRSVYDEGHIPSAGFLDLQGDFSDNSAPLRFTLPDEEHFAAAAAAAGISNQDHLVFYSTTMPMWATRFWWMFRTFGHQKVSVLNGGFGKWKAEGREVSTDTVSRPASTYEANRLAERIASHEDIRTGIKHSSTCILNALSREQHMGEGPNYGRPGRISGSDIAPAMEMVNRDTGEFLSATALEQKLSTTGALAAEKVITYCGGGIAASTTLFSLALLGHEAKVALYDASLSEWANLPDAPMDTGTRD